MKYNELNEKAKLNAMECFKNEFCPYEDLKHETREEIEYSLKQIDFDYEENGQIIFE